MRVLDTIFWLFAAGVVAFIAWNFIHLLVSSFRDRGGPTPERKPKEGKRDPEGAGGIDSGAALAGTYGISDSHTLDTSIGDTSISDSSGGDSSSGDSDSGGGNHSGGGGDYGGGGSSGGW